MGSQILAGTLSGNNINVFLGYLEAAMSSSLESLIFCNEAIDISRRIVEGVDVSAESLAEDVINSVGPNGNFLGEEHTRNHFRERWMPKSFLRTTYDKWAAEGKKDFRARAVEKVDEIVAAGPRKPLDPEVLAELDAIVKNCEAQY